MNKLYILSLFLFYFILPVSTHAQTWKPLGPDENDNPSVSGTLANNITIAPDGTPYIAYSEARYGDRMSVKKLVGSKWVLVGQPGFTEGYDAGDISLVFSPDGTPYVCYDYTIQGQNNLYVGIRKFSGGAWVGYNSFLAYGVWPSLSLSPDGTPYFAYAGADGFGSGLNVKKITTSWDYVGDTTNVSGSVINSNKLIVASDGTPYVAYAATKNKNKAVVKKFVNGIWQYVGSTGFTNAGASNVTMALATDGSIYVAYSDSTNAGKAMVQQFKNGSWTNTSPAGLSTGAATFLSLALAPDQTPYLTFSDAGNGNKLSVTKYSSGGWSNVGPSGISSSAAREDHIAIDANGVPYISYGEYIMTGKLMVKKFTGNQWTDVVMGSVTEEGTSALSLKVTPSNAIFTLFKDPAIDNRVSVKQYQSGSWQYVGASGISPVSSKYLDMDVAPDGTPYVIYNDSTQNYNSVVKKYSGSAWSQVGSNITTGGNALFCKIAIAPDGSPYAAYANFNYNGQITVRKYSGGAWGPVGQTEISTHLSSNINIAIDKNNTPIVAYTDASTTKANVKTFTGGAWVSLGASDFSPGGADHLTMTLAPDGTPYVAYYDTQKGKLAVEAYINNSWGFVGGQTASDSLGNAPKLIFDQNGQLYLTYLQYWTFGGHAIVRKLSQGQWVDAGANSIMPWAGNENGFGATSTGDLIYAYTNPQLYVRIKSSDSLAVAPVITTCTPVYGGTGTVVNITGFNFSKATSVKFGTTVAASFAVISPTQITAIVGAGASGLVSVTTPNGTGTFDSYVFSAAPPIITSFSPQSGNVGSSITINGKHFGSSPTDNIVYFGAVTAQVISANDSTLVVKVPAGSTYAPITVTTRQLTAYSSGFFNATFKSKGTFDASSFTKKNFTTLPQPHGLLISDIDNDGKSDIMVTSYGTPHYSMFQNTSSINNLSIASQTGSGIGDYAITGTDLDGDGKIDIVCSQAPLSMARNKSTTGNFSFGGTEYYQTNQYAFDVSSNDLDGDGRPDIVAANNQADLVSILRNSSSQKDYTFFDNEFDLSSLDFFAESVRLADLDGDGKPEIILEMSNDAAFSGNGAVEIYKNTSTSHQLSFMKAAVLSTGKYPKKPVIADIDGDGKLDIVVTNSGSNTVSVFKNQTANTISFGTKVDFTTGTQPSAVCAVDLDGDGKPDIAVTNAKSNTVSIFKNTSTPGNITLAANVDYATGNYPVNVMAGDIDVDGAPELVVANSNDNTISIFRNNTLITTTDIITFNAIPNATYGDADITLTATSTDKINPITFASSDNTVVSIVTGGKAHVLKPGIVTITAQQTNGTATPVKQTLKVLPAKPVITANGPLTFNTGGNVVLTASSGTGYTYQWAKDGVNISSATNSSFTATQSGSYTVTVSVNGVSNTSDATVVNVSGLSIPTITASGPLTFNTGGNVVLSSSTGTGYTYQWAKDGVNINSATNTSFTATQSGSYTVTVSINGVTSTSAATVVTVQSGSTTPAITTSGTLSDLSTIYGSASSSTNFSVSGTNLTTGVTVTAPAGFEVSSDNVNFSNQIIIGSAGTLSSAQVYIRIAASTPAGSYVGNIVLTSGTATVNVPMVYSKVNLAADNYKITITSATCRGSSNGSVNITASQNLNYVATINGNGVNAPYPFTTSVDITNLAPGPYSICITVAGQPSYQQCYDVSVAEPKDLSVYSTINNANSTISLALNGATQYNIDLNGKQYTTTDNSITLPLIKGNNNLSITTDKLCQGIVQKLINISGVLAPYPDPFQNILYLNTGDKNINHVAVEIHDVADARVVYSKQFVNQSGVLQLDVAGLRQGAYILHLTMDNSEKVFKILKNEN